MMLRPDAEPFHNYDIFCIATCKVLDVIFQYSESLSNPIRPIMSEKNDEWETGRNLYGFDIFGILGMGMTSIWLKGLGMYPVVVHFS